MLPLLLAALVLRVLLPADSMMSGVGAMSLQGSMCTTKADKNAALVLPVDAGAGKPKPVHCERCYALTLAAPHAAPRIAAPARAAAAALTRAATQVCNSPLVRAQSARAPPQA